MYVYIYALPFVPYFKMEALITWHCSLKITTFSTAHNYWTSDSVGIQRDEGRGMGKEREVWMCTCFSVWERQRGALILVCYLDFSVSKSLAHFYIGGKYDILHVGLSYRATSAQLCSGLLAIPPPPSAVPSSHNFQDSSMPCLIGSWCAIWRSNPQYKRPKDHETSPFQVW